MKLLLVLTFALCFSNARIEEIDNCQRALDELSS